MPANVAPQRTLNTHVPWVLTIQMKHNGQYLAVWQFIMLHKVVLTFAESAD